MMKRTQLLIAALIFCGVAIGFWAIMAFGAPQTGNGNETQTGMWQQSFDATEGAAQAVIVGSRALTPQTGNDDLNLTQMLQQAFVASEGAFQWILSDSGDYAPIFGNLSGLVDGQVLRYEDTDERWHNTSNLIIDDDGYATWAGSGTNNSRMFFKSSSGEIKMAIQVSATFASLFSAGGSTLDIQGNANLPVVFFLSSTEGETQTLSLYGYRTGDALRNLDVSINDTMDDAALLEGVGTIGMNTGIAPAVTDVNAATYTIQKSDYFVSVSYTATGAVTLTMPSAAACYSADGHGCQFLIKDTGANAATNNITVNRAGSDTFVTTATGQTSNTISTDGGAFWIHAISASSWAVY